MNGPDGRGAPPVVVVGGGIAGLAAAWELTGGARPDPTAPAVTVIESSRRLGGPLHSQPFCDQMVDVGPDAFLGRRPEAAELCRQVGLGDQLVPLGASGASLYARGALRSMPEGLMLGVPTRWWPVARSGILGPMASIRLLRDLVVPRPDRRGPLGDRALGPLVAHRLGARTVDMLVDPLVGGIHAGSVVDMSTAAVLPLLLAMPRRGSLMRSLRRAGRGSVRSSDEHPDPVFWSLRGGMGSLVDRLDAQLRQREVKIHLHRAATGLLHHHQGHWIIETSTGPVQAGGVVLATPAATSAALLEPLDADAAALGRTIEYGSVSVLTLCYRSDHVELPAGTGFLVPAHTPSPLPGDHEELLITAGTFLDQKWPHLARPGHRLLRASAGRFGDQRSEQLDDGQLTERLVAELEAILPLTDPPVETMVTRWHHAFPQYRVGHLLRVSGLEAAVGRFRGLAIAGASYRGVGIPACIASGREAARQVARSLNTPAATS